MLENTTPRTIAGKSVTWGDLTVAEHAALNLAADRLSVPRVNTYLAATYEAGKYPFAVEAPGLSDLGAEWLDAAREPVLESLAGDDPVAARSLARSIISGLGLLTVLNA